MQRGSASEHQQLRNTVTSMSGPIVSSILQFYSYPSFLWPQRVHQNQSPAKLSIHNLYATRSFRTGFNICIKTQTLPSIVSYNSTSFELRRPCIAQALASVLSLDYRDSSYVHFGDINGSKIYGEGSGAFG